MIWIETKDFTDYGGWRLDTQFVELMGSAFLLAAGTGEPVGDATTTIHLPKGGTYRVWVRNRNWLKDYSPGQFRLAINGRVVGRLFGCGPTDQWVWESAGDCELDPGSVHIALKDETGHFGRCAAILLTTDPEYVPPDGVDDIRQQRSGMTGISLEPHVSSGWDVIVVGAGAAGCCAAIAAARHGARTALLDRFPEPGGNAYLGVPLNGAASCHFNARETGIVEEVSRTCSSNKISRSECFKRLIQAEPNLTFFPNQVVIAVEMDGPQRITAVKTIGTLRNTVALYQGKIFIDCSGDGCVGYYAGAEYRCGREARHEYNEALAPATADNILMSGVLFREAFIYKAIDTGKPVAFTPLPWAYPFLSEAQLSRSVDQISYGNWWFEHRGSINEFSQTEQARDDLLRITFGWWNYVKNVWSGREKATNYALKVVATTLAKRETRRLLGDYVLTQNDVQGDTLFDDRIAYGGWTLDIHHPDGMFSGEKGPYDFGAGTTLYQIPFRCLYSRTIGNLLFAGRNASVTHVALGTVRIQRTLACLGQVAGTAAARCAQGFMTPREFGQKQMKQFQQLLVKDDLSIPGVRNEDPQDLARTATVTASSVDPCMTFGNVNCQLNGYLPLDRPRAMMFPVGLRKELLAVTLLLKTTRSEWSRITLSVREAQGPGDFTSIPEIAAVTAVIPPDSRVVVPGWPHCYGPDGFGYWVKFGLNRQIAAPYVWLELPATAGVWWGTMAVAPASACRAELEAGKWAPTSNEYQAFYPEPPLDFPPHDTALANHAPENVINGLARSDAGSSNMWISDPQQPLPQWLDLDFGKPVALDTVHLTFDTDLNVDDSHKNQFHPPECVRDYTLSTFDGSDWKVQVEVKNNYLRHRRHAFATASCRKLRLTVQATAGHRAARVFEIRAYGSAVKKSR